jgi:hypothetical protein
VTPDLALVIDIWPDLPDAIRAGILTLINASRNTDHGFRE